MIIQGGNWGSEAKSLFCGYKAGECDVAVRTGSINAGHTVEYKGKFYAMQTIPVAWINPKCKLVIGAGAYVHPDILANEIKMVEDATGEKLHSRLYIDGRAGLQSDEHKDKEAGLHERMGSTGKGVSEAIIDKMRRRNDYAGFVGSLTGYAEYRDATGKFQVIDTEEYLNDMYDNGATIMIEGTQGTLLDLHFGDYPYVTARQTLPSSWMAEAGLSPNLNTEIAMVVRTYPIRVAGNSGSMGEDKELSWVEFGATINHKRAKFGMPPLVTKESLSLFDTRLMETAKERRLPDHESHTWTTKQKEQYSEQLVNLHTDVLKGLPDGAFEDLCNLFEMTTVTKKLRRIAKTDLGLLRQAVRLCRPDYLVITFLNYEFPNAVECNTIEQLMRLPNIKEITKYLEMIEKETNTKVGYVSCNKYSTIPWRR